MKDITVMLTASGSQFAPGIIKCLKKNGERKITVIGGDMGADLSNRFLVDRFYQIPSAKAADYVQKVVEICEKEKVDILIPQMSAELSPYLEHIELFERVGTTVSMTLNENVNIANNKLKLFQFLTRCGVSVPRYECVYSIREFDDAIVRLGYPERPVCVKMTESSGSRGVRIIDDKKSRFDLFALEKPASLYISLKDMRTVLLEPEQFPELLLMQYLPGDEYSVDLLADKGKILYIAGRRNPVVLMSIPQETIIEKNEQAYEIANQVVSNLHLDGNIGLDFIFDDDGNAQLIEVNPRLDATIALFAAAGLNFPYLRVKQLLREPLPKVDVQYGVSLKRRYLEMFIDDEGKMINW